MDCFVNSGIYLRANGTIYCGCDAGAFLPLQAFDPHIDYVKDVYLGQKFDNIRYHLREGKAPFSEICHKCVFLSVHEKFDPSYAVKKTMKVFHVEPSFACILECPSCTKIADRKRIMPKTDAGHMFLRSSILEKVLVDMAKHRIKVGHFQVEGHGEPLMNKDIWNLIALIRKYNPTSSIAITTNAHAVFKPKMLESGLDEIIFSVDGVDQETYSAYRRGGDFNKAITFLKDFTAASNNSKIPVRTVWKYVVFKHNDKPEHLLKAQKLAREAGVSKVLFILTSLGPVSNSIYESQQVPLLENGVPVEIVSTHIPIDQFKQRLIELIKCGINQFNDLSINDKIQSACMSLLSHNVAYREMQYNVLRNLVEESVNYNLFGHVLLIILHDRLVREGLFKPSAQIPKHELFFDEDYYLAHNQDVASAVKSNIIESGFEHFRRDGRLESRVPYPMKV
jgi:wyosine [tRNA(Phe)-imidazoG37] synthetase (radical SAM superfamily)